MACGRIPKLSCVREFHSTWAYVSVIVNGLVGLWGLLLARGGSVPRLFYWGVGLAIGSLSLQVLLGAYLLSLGGVPGEQHTFYGVVIAVTFTFVYIYRSQFRRRPALYYGLLLLFTMGLGIRGIMTFGLDF